MDKKLKILIIGFVLLTLGFTSLVLGIVGIRFSFLAFLDYFGAGIGFSIKIVMILFGFMLAALANSIPNKK